MTLLASSFLPHRNPPPPPVQRPNRDPYQMVAIKEELIHLGQELGQGEFGSVLKGVYKDKGKKVRLFNADHVTFSQSDPYIWSHDLQPIRSLHLVT